MPRNVIADLVPVVLAGGSGTRLWPESRAALPKHLVGLFGASSLLQDTARRIAALAPPGHFLTIAAARQAILVERQLNAIDAAFTRHLLLEPEGRNTAAAVALAALYAAQAWGPDALLWICPSDHLVSDPERLYDAVEAGADAARDGRLVTFGINARRPETGYGYIRLGPSLDTAPGVLSAAAFIEKPPLAQAQEMLGAGDHVWNSGMFLFRTATILAELEEHAPAILAATRAALGPVDEAGGARLDRQAFAAIPAAPIDKAVMEKSARVAVVPCEPGWSDVGSWQAIWEVMPQDEAANALLGDAVVLQGQRNLVRAGERLVTLAGVDDIAVIETADAVLVARRDDADAVKALVEQLTAAERPEATRHRREPQAWGVRTRLIERHGYRLNELEVDPRAALDLTWQDNAGGSLTVVEGVLEIDGDVRHTAGAVVTGFAGTIRLCNPEATPLRLVETVLD